MARESIAGSARRSSAVLYRRLRELLRAMQVTSPGLVLRLEFEDEQGRILHVQSAGIRRSNQHLLTQIDSVMSDDGRQLARLLAEPTSSPKRVRQAFGRLAGIIIEHNRIEAALTLNEQKYRALYDDNPSMFFTLDWQGRVLSANRYGAAQLGYRCEELEHRAVIDLFHPDDRRAVTEQISACLRSPGQLKQWEARKQCRDGSLMWVREAARAVVCPDASLCVYVVCQDITDRVKAEAQVQQHQAELAHVTRLATMGEMASGLAHEINQPLYAIGNYAEAVLEMVSAMPASPVLMDSLRSMAEQASRASEIVRRMRHFARKPSADRAPTDINSVVRNAVRLITADAIKDSVTISMRLARNLNPTEVDGLQIEQILLNLLRNAIEAIRAANKASGGQIFVSTRQLNAGIKVLVRDTGPGVVRGDFARIFDPFVTSKPQGLGMGLSICRTLIEAHQGRLWVTSKAGQGAIFHVLLQTGDA